MADVRILLVSTYELGHQPVHLAAPAGALRAAGHDVRCVDLAVDPWDPGVLDGIERVAISVPMHTATRLAQQIVDDIDVPVVRYGLYGDPGFQSEYLDALLEWANLWRGTSEDTVPRHKNGAGVLPARDLLTPLDRYAQLAIDGTTRLAGAVE